jgi:ACS family glucarate transporter-like MFS transporter
MTKILEIGQKVRTASKTRWTLLRFAFALSVITYLDRVCISMAAPAIREELRLSPVQLGWIFSAFTFAYAVFEIPSGWLGDVVGPRKVLTRIVLWWSAFTAATGLTRNFQSLFACRFLFGAGEAGAFPNLSRSFARWFPPSERGRAHGIIFMGTRLGASVTPPLVVIMIRMAGWRSSFGIFGLLGMVWAWLWWRWFRDDPAQHSGVNEEELSLIRRASLSRTESRVPWKRLLSPNLLKICLMYFCVGYGLYFYLTWLPTYLTDARGFSTQSAGYFSGAILFAAALANVIGGLWTDRWVKQYGLKIGRCAIGAIVLPLSAVVLVAAVMVQNVLMAVVLMGAAAGLADLCMSSSWAICLDVGKDSAGTVTGCMNTFGNLGGAISPLVVGYAVQSLGSWTLPFFVTAGVYVLGGILTTLIDPGNSLAEEQ